MHHKTACQKSSQMVFFSWAVVSFCVELFGVVTLQYQMSEEISIACLIIIKKSCATALTGHRAAILFNLQFDIV